MTTTKSKTAPPAPAADTKEQTPEAATESKDLIESARTGPPDIPMGTTGLVFQNMQALWWLAQRVMESGLAPKDCKNTADAFIRMQMSAELGLSPMQGLQSIAVINGRPSLWGDAVPGLVIAKGKPDHPPLVEQIGTEPKGNADFPDDFGFRCTVSRGGKSIACSFTVADAKRAKLWAKDTYQQYPKRMLKTKAVVHACKDLFPDVLKGIAVVEEMDYIDVIATPTAPRPKPARNVDDLADRLESEMRADAADDDPPADPETGEIIEAEINPVAEAPTPAKPAARKQRTEDEIDAEVESLTARLNLSGATFDQLVCAVDNQATGYPNLTYQGKAMLANMLRARLPKGE